MVVTKTKVVTDRPPSSVFILCDTKNARIGAKTDSLVDALVATRKQRDECAARVSAGARWDKEAAAREKARAAEEP